MFTRLMFHDLAILFGYAAAAAALLLQHQAELSLPSRKVPFRSAKSTKLARYLLDCCSLTLQYFLDMLLQLQLHCCSIKLNYPLLENCLRGVLRAPNLLYIY